MELEMKILQLELKTGIEFLQLLPQRLLVNQPLPNFSLTEEVMFSSVQLISGRRLRRLSLCPDLGRSMRLMGHMGLSYDRIGRGGLSGTLSNIA